ncbi:MAG: hypothetical protein LBQ10_11990 [Desulfovibrio sp.]|jgi:hypothetical protein|nr:hypothetical protein [Desulfovibrio sp.]
MPISLKGLSGPDDIAVDGKRGNLLGYAPSGGGVSVPKWEVGNPAAVAMAGLQKASESFAAVWDDVQVNDYLLKKRKELDDYYNNPDTGAFRMRQRDKAKGMYAEYQDMARKMWDEDAPKHLNKRQMGKATKPFAAMFRDYGHRVGSFETEQLMDAQVDTAKNVIFEATNLVAGGNFTEEALGASLAQVAEATREIGRMQGWDEATLKRKTQENVGNMLVKGAMGLAAERPTLAKGMLRTHKDDIPAAMYDPAMKTIKAHERAEAARARAENERSDNIALAEAADLLREGFKDNPLGAREEIERLSGGDKKKQAKLETAFLQSLNRWQAFESEQLQVSKNTELNEIRGLAAQIQQMPEEQRVPFVDKTLAGLRHADNYSLSEKILSHAAGIKYNDVTDPVAKATAKTKIIEGESYEDVMQKYGGGISGKDRAELEEFSIDVEQRQTAKAARRYMKDYTAISGMNPRTSPSDEEYLAEVQNELDDAMLDGGLKGAEAVRAWIYEKLAKRPGRFYGTNTARRSPDLRAVDSGNPRLEAARALLRAGIPVTKPNIDRVLRAEEEGGI